MFSVLVAAFHKQVNIRCSIAIKTTKTTATKTTSENLIFFFLENNRVQ